MPIAPNCLAMFIVEAAAELTELANTLAVLSGFGIQPVDVDCSLLLSLPELQV